MQDLKKNKDKLPRPITPAEEMAFSRQEVEATLPIEEKAYEEELSESQEPQQKEDYLDESPNQQQQNPKQFSQPMMFNEEEKRI